MKNAWAFYRRSTNQQELSIEGQRAACQQKARELGLTIVREFIPPKGYASGLSIETDPAFQDMVRRAEDGTGVTTLLIYDVSRLGRLAPRRKFYWEEHLRRHGVSVVYAAESFQQDGSLGDDIHQFVSHSEAHQYSIRLRESTLRGAKQHASLGRSCGGRPPYGYGRKLVDGNGADVKALQHGERKSDKLQHVVWTIGPAHEVREVRGMFAAKAAGKGLGLIAEGLNRRRVPAPRGGAWAKSTVQAVLKNAAYVGTRVYFRHNYHDRTNGALRVRVRPESEWTVTENAHPAIVDRALFDQVQATFRKNGPRRGRSHDSPHLLAGLLTCARCGHSYYGQRKKGETYYVCGGYHTKGPTFCAAYAVRGRALEKHALQRLEDKVLELRDAGATRASFAELARAASGPEESAVVRSLQAELSQTDAEIARMVIAIRTGGPLGALVAELSKLEERKAGLKDRLKWSQRLPVPAAPDEYAAVLAELTGDLPAMLEEGTTAERRAVLREFMREVVIDPEKREARFDFHRIPPVLLKGEGPGAGAPRPSTETVAGARFGPLWIDSSTLSLVSHAASAQEVRAC